jgi:hypothetical protein
MKTTGFTMKLISLPIELLAWFALSGSAPTQSLAADLLWAYVKLPSGRIARLGDPDTITQTKGVSAEERQVNLALILNASGSMNTKPPGGNATKLEIAKSHQLHNLFPEGHSMEHPLKVG